VRMTVVHYSRPSNKYRLTVSLPTPLVEGRCQICFATYSVGGLLPIAFSLTLTAAAKASLRSHARSPLRSGTVRIPMKEDGRSGRKIKVDPVAF
jgi:hypothetical protein